MLGKLGLKRITVFISVMDLLEKQLSQLELCFHRGHIRSRVDSVCLTLETAVPHLTVKYDLSGAEFQSLKT